MCSVRENIFCAKVRNNLIKGLILMTVRLKALASFANIGLNIW